MKFHARLATAATVAASAALIAAGCGGGSGASEAVKDSKALDFVPKDAVGYVTVDTNFDGEGWKQFNDLARAFDADFEPIEKQIGSAVAEEDEKYDYEKDIKPWLGESGGAAILAASSKDEDDSEEYFAWLELEDRAKFEDFLEKEDMKKGKEVGDFTTWSGSDTFVGVQDDLAIIAPSNARLEKTLKYEGDSITDADGLDDVIGEVEGDTLVALVVSGPGVRKALKEDPQYEQASDVEQLKKFQGLSVGFGAEDDGMRLHGFAGFDGLDDNVIGENSKKGLFEDLPGNTLFAIGGENLGGNLKDITDAVGEDSPAVQQAVGGAGAALGVTMDDLAKAFSGRFAIALSGEDEGLQSVAGSAVGAAMFGSDLGDVDPAALGRASTFMLVFDKEKTTEETLDRMMRSAGGLAGGNPKEGEAGDFTTTTMDIEGLTVTSGHSDDVSALTFGADVLTGWGESSLGDNETYEKAWKAADGPDEVSGALWIDMARIAKFMELESGEDVEPGGLVGWAESDDDDVKFDVFMHVEER